MSHLNVRMTEEDENNLLKLKNSWHLDRSDITRKALALAASMIKKEEKMTKEELLKNSQFIGSEGPSEFTSTNYKDYLRNSLRQKYGSQSE